MGREPACCDTEYVTQLTSSAASRWQIPRIDRNERVLGGVAAAIAIEVGVQPLVIRTAFVILALAGGWGLVVYALAWAVTAVAAPNRISPYRPQPKGATSTHRHVAVGSITLGLLILFARFSSDVFNNIVFPLGFVLTGALIAWSRGQNDEGLSVVARVVAGVTVAVGGLIAFAALQFSLVDAIVALIFGLAIVAGIAIVAAPSVIRLGRDLDTERQDRVRQDERARISAHLHDSVLQTLSLIQRHADDPARTTQIARQQERELRGWLYGPGPSASDRVRLQSGLEAVATRVEQSHDIVIEVIAVGDSVTFERPLLTPLLDAAGEAMTNAAKHAGVPRIDVYAEHRDAVVEVFIRDTGVGFEPDDIDADRRGVTESIIARMRRAGGEAIIHASVDAGTEVELRLPIPEGATQP